MKFAMNNTVINGTPRTTSMNVTQTVLTKGSSDLRPSARITPIGSEKTMPTIDISNVIKRPPQSVVSMTGK